MLVSYGRLFYYSICRRPFLLRFLFLLNTPDARAADTSCLPPVGCGCEWKNQPLEYYYYWNTIFSNDETETKRRGHRHSQQRPRLEPKTTSQDETITSRIYAFVVFLSIFTHTTTHQSVQPQVWLRSSTHTCTRAHHQRIRGNTINEYASTPSTNTRDLQLTHTHENT